MIPQAEQYPYNVRVDVGGITLTGPGMDGRAEAEGIKLILETSGLEGVEVFEQ